jgi:Ca2+-binding RTX toxin-like protein
VAVAEHQPTKLGWGTAGGARGGDSLVGDIVVFRNNGNDILKGATGRDVLDGGPGFDDLYGGDGDDLSDTYGSLTGHPEDYDEVFAGTGVDTIDVKTETPSTWCVPAVARIT